MEQNKENEELLPDAPPSDVDGEIQKLIQARDELQDRLLRRQAEVGFGRIDA